MLWDFTEGVQKILHIPALKSVHVLQAESSRLLGVQVETLSLKTQRTALAGAEAVTVPTRAAAGILARDHPSSAPKLRIIPFGVDDSESIRQAVRAHEYGPPGPLLYVGRFSEIKGTPDFFHALCHILPRHPEVPVVVAGGIPDSRKMEARWKRKLTNILPESLRGRVEFTGWVSGKELASLYSTARLLVSPSRLETYGLAVLEGMLYGLPVVGTETPGTTDLVVHGRTGLLSSPGDPRRFAHHILELLANIERARQMGQYGAEAIRNTRLWSHIVPDLVAVYRELLSPSKRF